MILFLLYMSYDLNYSLLLIDFNSGDRKVRNFEKITKVNKHNLYGV